MVWLKSFFVMTNQIRGLQKPSPEEEIADYRPYSETFQKHRGRDHHFSNLSPGCGNEPQLRCSVPLSIKGACQCASRYLLTGFMEANSYVQSPVLQGEGWEGELPGSKSGKLYNLANTHMHSRTHTHTHSQQCAHMELWTR